MPHNKATIVTHYLWFEQQALYSLTARTTDSNPTTMASKEKEDWPVKLYRHTSRGWEKQTSGDGLLLATPQKGSIEIRLLKVRISLSHEGDAANENNNQEDRCLIVRRGKAILIHSRWKMRSVVLAFRNDTDCLEFSDRLVLLNPSNIESSLLMTQTLIPSPHHHANGQPHFALTPQGTGCSQESQAYMMRLLHEDGFLQLMHNIEDTLTSSEDGAKMLNAFLTNDA